MRNTIVFDIGDVLMTFDNVAYLHRLFPDPNTVQHVFNAIWGSGYWDELDRGEDQEMMFGKMLEREPGFEEEIRSLPSHFHSSGSQKSE